MKLVEIEAFEDRTRPEGGHAVIVLRGVESVAGCPAFRLRPVDGGRDGGRLPPWAERELEPLAVETRDGSAGLIVGPELTGNPTLQPGLPLEISVPALAARGKFLWPAVAPPARPKRPSIAAERPGAPMRSTDAATNGKPATAPVDAPPGAAATRRVTTAVLATPVPQTDTFDFSVQEASTAAAPKTEPGPEDDGTATAEAPPPASVRAGATGAREKAVPRAVEPSQAPASADAGVSNEVEVPVARRDAGSGQNAPASGYGLIASILAVVLGLQLIGLIWFDVKLYRRGTPPPVPVAAAPPARPLPVSAAATPAATPLIYDALVRGPVSPRGVAAEDVSPARALERAHAMLRSGSGQRDTEEGIYWLKHHLATSVGTERSRIVLTQLGSAYAEPSSGPPDFGKARAVWELAAAFGDPVAMCFLAVVHERGLAVAADAGIAAEWLGRAQAAGGSCPTAAAAGAPVKR